MVLRVTELAFLWRSTQHLDISPLGQCTVYFRLLLKSTAPASSRKFPRCYAVENMTYVSFRAFPQKMENWTNKCFRRKHMYNFSSNIGRLVFPLRFLSDSLYHYPVSIFCLSSTWVAALLYHCSTWQRMFRVVVAATVLWTCKIWKTKNSAYRTSRTGPQVAEYFGCRNTTCWKLDKLVTRWRNAHWWQYRAWRSWLADLLRKAANSTGMFQLHRLMVATRPI